MRLHCTGLLLVCTLVTHAVAGEFEVVKEADGITVQFDGQLVTRYITKSGPKPILWPIIGPTGQPMTRAYPMIEEGLPGEKLDHIHHRSLWFTHGDINGVDFWAEQRGAEGRLGSTQHREFLKIEGGKTAVIQTRNDWITSEGQKLLEDVRTVTVGKLGEATWIDFDIQLTATEEVTFGDTKEGTFGIRVAETMKVDAKLGGTILNSRGQKDKDAWGKPAEWVDYVGPVAGQTVGIAIFNHPSSFRFPTPWHVRTYGLFAANPFGLKDFTGDENTNGSVTLNKGESLSLFYRVLVHAGDTQQAKVAEAYAAYAGEKKQ